MPKSGEKGKRGEREFCRFLRDNGFGAIRAEQNAGVRRDDDSADVITSLDEYVRWEVKRGYNDVKFWNAEFRGWCDKILAETPNQKTPVIAWRPDYADWYFLVPEENQVILYRNLTELVKGLDSRMFANMDTPYNSVLDQCRVADPEDWRSTGKFS